MSDIKKEFPSYICRECQPLKINCKFYRYYSTRCVAYLDD